MIRSYKDLKVFQLSYSLSMEIFWITKKFPKEELYSLTDQIRRSSRSIAANLVEGWSKSLSASLGTRFNCKRSEGFVRRHYENIFKRHIIDSIGSCDESKLWLKFALDCKYISEEEFNNFIARYDELGKMLQSLFDHWKTYEKNKK